MEKYIKPEISVIEFTDSIILTSGCGPTCSGTGYVCDPTEPPCPEQVLES